MKRTVAHFLPRFLLSLRLTLFVKTALVCTIIIISSFGLSATERDRGKNSITIYYGPAFYAAGNVISNANRGLNQLEYMVNLGLLYSPEVEAIKEALPPGLRYVEIPEWDVKSNQYGIEYERQWRRHLAWGIGLKYFDFTAGVDMPSSYIDLADRIGMPGYIQVTKRQKERIFLTGIYQLEFLLAYYFRPEKLINPYVKVFAGAGSGWMAPYGKGAHIEEYHGGLATGIRWQVSHRTFLLTEATYTGYEINSGNSPRLIRTRTLLNPGDGDLLLGRINFGFGFQY